MIQPFDGLQRWVPLRSRGYLPHLELPGATYFVTFRAADAVRPRPPQKAADPTDPEAVARASEPPLRAGACVLVGDDIGQVVAGALRRFDGERYLLGAYCVMPNHVHALVAPLGHNRIPGILHSWKSFTAWRINRALGHRGRFWEREYFDHVVHDESVLRRFAEYVEWNPVLAGLCDRPEQWRFSSAFGRRAGEE